MLSICRINLEIYSFNWYNLPPTSWIFDILILLITFLTWLLWWIWNFLTLPLEIIFFPSWVIYMVFLFSGFMIFVINFLSFIAWLLSFTIMVLSIVATIISIAGFSWLIIFLPIIIVAILIYLTPLFYDNNLRRIITFCGFITCIRPYIFKLFVLISRSDCTRFCRIGSTFPFRIFTTIYP
jgi:hypothetical protein